MSHQLRLYAHRGASLRCPENSLEAFRQGLKEGANALEMDVHATADGHFVVTHDPDGERLMADRRRIRDLPLAEVKRWRHCGADTSIPTLEEVLENFDGVPMSIDLKPDDPDLVPPFLECLTRSGGESTVTIASFHHRVLKRVHLMGWKGRTALSRLEIAALRFAPLSVARRLVRGHSAQIPTTAGPVRLDRSTFLKRCRRLDLRIDYWVVNDPFEARALLQQGATGLMTDDPALIAPVMREFTNEGNEAVGKPGAGGRSK
ncbi:MAG: hypothetical protein K8R59_15670 [Thermoanaerobaculales bacterium]|nr:hypothetical protein [Thermoanaerobaculales bacterium]